MIIIGIIGCAILLVLFIIMCKACNEVFDDDYTIYRKKDGSIEVEYHSKNSKITDYGCREDFSQRYEDDPWSMFRG